MEEEALRGLTVVRLRELLRERGLRVSGRKSELVERLLGSAEIASPEPRTPPRRPVVAPVSTGHTSARKAAALSPRVEPTSPYRPPRGRGTPLGRLRRSDVQEEMEEEDTLIEDSEGLILDELVDQLHDGEDDTYESEMEEERQATLDALLDAVVAGLEGQWAVEQIRAEAHLEKRDDWSPSRQPLDDLAWDVDVEAARHAACLVFKRANHYWRLMLLAWIVGLLALWMTFELWAQMLPASFLEASRTSWLGLFTMLFLPYASLAWWSLGVHRWSFSQAFAEHERHLPNPTVRALTARICDGLVRHQQRSNAALFLIGQFAAWGCRAFAVYTVGYVAVEFYWAYVNVRARME